MSDQDDFDMGSEYEDVESLLQELQEGDLKLESPPDDVWAGIQEALENDDAASPASPLAAVPPVADVVPLTRARRAPRLIGAAIAAALLVAVGVAAVMLRDGADPVQLAVADLEFDSEAFDPLGADATATALLEEDDGVLRLRLERTDLPAAVEESADLELWMISLDDEGNPDEIVSLGLVDPKDPVAHRLPDGVDPDVHFIVDISVEPRDGDAAHSGRSILRGALTSV